MVHIALATLQTINWVSDQGSEIGLVLVGKNAEGDDAIVSMSLATADQVGARIAEALKQVRQGAATPNPQPSPEAIVAYNASSWEANPEEVLVLLEGDRSGRILWRMQRNDASRLAALLRGSAERGAPKRAN